MVAGTQDADGRGLGGRIEGEQNAAGGLVRGVVGLRGLAEDAALQQGVGHALVRVGGRAGFGVADGERPASFPAVGPSDGGGDGALGGTLGGIEVDGGVGQQVFGGAPGAAGGGQRVG